MEIMCISDTHSLKTSSLLEADVLVVAGDFCNYGDISEVCEFNELLNSFDCSNKIVVAGNHDVIFEDNKSLAVQSLQNATYLQDSSIIIDNIKFYGSPWQPKYGNWAFNLAKREELKERWDLIPNDTDVLITHSPPFGILDNTGKKKNGKIQKLGCKELMKAVRRIKPKLHVFGHIHGSYGIFEKKWKDGSKTTFINASICTEDYTPINRPQVFTLEDE